MYFELYFQYNNKLVSVFKELLVIIRFLNENEENEENSIQFSLFSIHKKSRN